MEATEPIDTGDKISTVENEKLAGSNLNSESKYYSQFNLNNKRGNTQNKKKKAEPNASVKSKVVDEITEKENDGWEVVEASSDESDTSGNTEYDIMIPLKLVENTKDNVHGIAPVISVSSSRKEITVDANVKGCAIIDSDSKKIVHQPTANKNIIHQPTQNEASVNENNINQNTEKQFSANETQKEQFKTAKSNVVKKRKIRLYTGDSSDDDTTQKPTGNNAINIIEEGNKIKVQNVLSPLENAQREDKRQEKDHTVSKTFMKDKTKKFHSDTEITVQNSSSTRENYTLEQNCSKLPKLCDIAEGESDDEDIVEVPRSPHAIKSNHFMIPSRKEKITRENSTLSHDCHCSVAPLLSSPNSKRSKRQKLMQQMWQDRERKLKQKMVKKVKNVFFQVLESLVSSSDESDSPVSEDEDKHPSKVMRKEKQPCRKQCCAHSLQEEQKSENIRDLKRELNYWKNKASINESEGLSPQELQIRDMKADLNYWKRIATSRSISHDLSCSSHSIPRTSTPEKPENKLAELPTMCKPHEISRVSSSADISTHIPQHTNHSRQVEYISDEVINSNHTKIKDHHFQNDHVKPSNSSHPSTALSVMSRTKFTEKEKDQIIEYLVSHYDRLELLKGNMFWMQMAHDLDTHRSWHSLKNSFFQNIIKNLEQYEMPNKVRNKIISLAKQYM